MPPVPTPRNAATQTPPDQQDRQRDYKAAAAKTKTKAAAVPVASALGPQIPGYSPVDSNTIWAQVQAAQLPAEQKINNAQATADATALGARQDINNYYSALGPLLNKIAPAVQQGYTQAADQNALLGKGFGNQFSAGDAAQNQQNQQFMGLTGGTMAPVDNSPVGNALGWLGGGLPATGINQVGAAANAQARMMPGQIGALGGEQVGLLARDQLAQDQAFNQQRADLAAQIPGLVLKYGAAAVDRALKQQAAQATAAYRAAQLDATNARITGYYQGADGKMHPTAATLATEQSNAFREAGLTGEYVGADGKVHQTIAGRNAESLAAAREAAMTGQYLGADGKVYPTLAAQTAATSAMLRGRGLDIAQGNLNLATTKSNNAITKYNNSIVPTLSSPRSKYNHYATDQFGHPMLDAKHQLVPEYGYKVSADGQHVVKDPKLASSTAQKMTATNVKNVADKLRLWKNGIVGQSQGRPTTDPAAALTYNQALDRAKSLLPNTAQGLKKATQLTNIEYGTPLKIALDHARTDLQQGLSAQDSIAAFAGLLKTGDNPIPAQVAITGIASVYGWAPTVVAELMDGLMRNTQVTGG